MYIKRLSAINMGPINDVSITFPFDESENPKPVIIVGENGTGKTTLLSNVVDSLYELAEKAFNDVTKSDSGSGHQYFKAISPSEIQIGKEYMCSIIEYTCPRNPTYSIGYVMKCGSVSADLIKSGNSFCANKKVSWKDTEGYKKAFIEKSEAETIFGRSVFCYFGPDRYEKPAWMGKRYYQQDEDIHPSIRERWQGQLRKPITVHDVNEQTLQWLLDIIADSRCDIVQKGDQLLVEHKLSISYNEMKAMSITINAPIQMTEISWPSSGPAKLIPKPSFSVGKISSDYDWAFSVYLGDMTIDDFNAYVDKCIDKGFEKDYRSEHYFSADKGDDISLTVEYVGFNTIVIRIYDYNQF